MYRVVRLFVDGGQRSSTLAYDREDAIRMADRFIRILPGIIVVEHEDGGIAYEVLNDGIDIVSVETLQTYSVA